MYLCKKIIYKHIFFMKKLLTSFCFSSLIVCVSAQTQAEFESMLSQINADSLKKTVQDLQDFGDRYCDRTPEGNRKVAQYLVDRLKNYGIENAKIDSFPVNINHWFIGNINRYIYNVVGRIFGESELDSTIIIGAHLDAIALDIDMEKEEITLLSTSPGADDNASGCAIMIEMARIFHKNNINPNIILIIWLTMPKKLDLSVLGTMLMNEEWQTKKL